MKKIIINQKGIFQIFIVIIFLSLSLLQLNCSTSLSSEIDDKIEPNPELRVLLIGSSYFNYNNMVGELNKFFKYFDKKVYIQSSITNGLYLADHVEREETLAKINQEKWDYVILQGVGTLMAYPDIYRHHPVYEAIEALKEKILANHSSTKIIFCMPWAFEDGMAWKEGWTDLYADMQEKIFHNTLKYAESLGLIIAPVGSAWNIILEERDYPLHYLHMSDWNHPSPRGTYVMVCVIYSTIFQEATTDIKYYAGIPSDEASYFQEVSSNIVLENLELWNLN